MSQQVTTLTEPSLIMYYSATEALAIDLQAGGSQTVLRRVTSLP